MQRLPDGYEYVLVNNDGFGWELRVNVSDQNEAETWRSKYEQHTLETWRVTATCPDSGRKNIYKVSFV